MRKLTFVAALFALGACASSQPMPDAAATADGAAPAADAAPAAEAPAAEAPAEVPAEAPAEGATP